MLPPAPSYDALRERFRWEIPDRYNMGVDVCDRWADAEPDRTALIDMTGADRRDVSYGTLRSLSSRLANTLIEAGVGPGDRIGVFRSQSVWTAAAHIAIWKMGAISIPLFTLFGADALAMRLKDAGAKAVVTDPANTPKISALGMENLAILTPETGLSGNTGFTPRDTAAGDPAVLIYTSGTTGAPKGALHAHRVLPGHLPGVEMSHDGGFRRGDVLWTPADWAWIGGLFDVLMPGLHHGVPIVAARFDKFTGAAAKALIEGTGVTCTFLPPTALKRLKADRISITGLRTVASGGEPLGAEMLAWGREALGVTINEFYGQTECNMVVSSCGALFDPRPGCIGKPVPGHDVTVLDPDSTGEGDIAIRRGSPVMMLEYWNNPAATAEKYRGDWLLTGDRGVMEDGFIRFRGRDDDVITSAGYRIGPSEIEDCLVSHPAVAAAGVVGRPDPERTERICAFVMLRDGVEPGEALLTELQTHVKTRLAAHEYPREIHFVEALPMTVTGKIVRRALRDWLKEDAR
ncbi:MAG: AMP-binding protein [Rubricella sp.]